MFKQVLYSIFVLISLILICIDGSEYFIGSNMGTYDDGINICLNDGGILATITNENDYNIARELCMNNNTECWIGLNDLYSEGFWSYIDGTSVKGTYGFDINGNPTVGNGPWHDDEPNNDNGNKPEDCVHFWDQYNAWKWNDYKCHNIKFPLCMRIETNPIKQFRQICLSSEYLFVRL